MLSNLAALVLTQSAAAPAALTEATFPAVRTHASPTKQDLAFQGIDWKTSIFDGLVQAQREDKPMVMWMYFGDPRGRC
ncbi:MAG: hypothetical protein ACO1SV_18975 [Fimbriimonas sp.]